MDIGKPLMINIVCLKWGKKYGSEYVNRLFYAAQRHATRNYKFWCFTEDHQGIDAEISILPLRFPDRLESWWNKISLFDPDSGLPIGEKIFYIDLDTLIVNNIDHLLLAAETATDIVVLRDFYHGIARTAGNVGSGLMSWRQGDHTEIWHRFLQDPMEAIRSVRPHGDQAWIESQLKSWQCWQDICPESVVSFKMHCQSGIPENARIICYHGVPGILESVTYHGPQWRWNLRPQPWVLDHWRDR